MSTYVKTILRQSIIVVIFIISFISGTFLLFDDFSIHAHSFISKVYYFIIHKHDSSLSQYIYLIKEVAFFFLFTHVCADLFLNKTKCVKLIGFDGDSYLDKVLGESQALYKTCIV